MKNGNEMMLLVMLSVFDDNYVCFALLWLCRCFTMLDHARLPKPAVDDPKALRRPHRDARPVRVDARVQDNRLFLFTHLCCE